MTDDYMYRAHIIEDPEFETYFTWDHRGDDLVRGIEWNRPVGWEASADYIERFRTNKFFEPDTWKWFKSRSSASSRVKLLESMGYRAIVQRSAPVQWPADGKKRVDTSESRRVIDAIRTLIRAGVVKSADDLL